MPLSSSLSAAASTRYTCHVTTPNGVVQPATTVHASTRLAAVREALSGYPAGSRATCRILSQTASVAVYLAARSESFPLIGAAR